MPTVSKVKDGNPRFLRSVPVIMHHSISQTHYIRLYLREYS